MKKVPCLLIAACLLCVLLMGCGENDSPRENSLSAEKETSSQMEEMENIKKNIEYYSFGDRISDVALVKNGEKYDAVIYFQIEEDGQYGTYTTFTSAIAAYISIYRLEGAYLDKLNRVTIDINNGAYQSELGPIDQLPTMASDLVDKIVITDASGNVLKPDEHEEDTTSSENISSEAVSSAIASAPSEVPKSDSSSEKVSSDAPAVKVDDPPPVPKTSYQAGMYKVGTDIPAGEYFLTATSSAYLSINSDSTGSFDSILENDNVSTFRYFMVNDGEYLTVSRGTFIPASDANAPEPKNGIYGEGMYKVGKDIPAGEYKVHSDGYGYLAVLSAPTTNIEYVITNDNFEGDKYITISDGQYFQLTRGSIIAE